MTDHKALIAEAQDPGRAMSAQEWALLALRLADALAQSQRELAFERLRKIEEQIEDVERRAEVEAQALEQAADAEAEHWKHHAQDHEVTVVMRILRRLRVRAVGIREGRQ